MSENESDLPVESTDEIDSPVESRKVEKPRRNNALGWFAALISLTALSLVAYRVFEDWRASDDENTIDYSAAMGDLEVELNDLESSSGDALAALEARIVEIGPQDVSGDIDELQRSVDEKLRLFDSLPARMSTLESSVASLAGISADARETFLLAEAEYYMQIANAQLQLANNPELASLALSMADERISQIPNPALIEVRRAISDELAALDLVEMPDIVGTTLTLASLARTLSSLPLAVASPAGTGVADDNDAERSGTQRAWQTVKDAMGSLVKVTPPDAAKLALISPDAEYFLRNNMALQLQAARLALLRGEQAIFEQALDDVIALIDSYFDQNSENVRKARETIGNLRSKIFSVSVPDISGSLNSLRQYKILRGTAE